MAERIGSFLLCLGLNLLLSWRRSIPAWILLVCHLWLGISIWWFVGGLILWVFSVLLGMWILGWAAACGSEKDAPKANKNPYSAKGGGK